MNGYAGESGILYSAISQYCRDHGIHGDDFRRFQTFLHAADAEYRAFKMEEMERASKLAGNRQPKG